MKTASTSPRAQRVGAPLTMLPTVPVTTAGVQLARPAGPFVQRIGGGRRMIRSSRGLPLTGICYRIGHQPNTKVRR